MSGQRDAGDVPTSTHADVSDQREPAPNVETQANENGVGDDDCGLNDEVEKNGCDAEEQGPDDCLNANRLRYPKQVCNRGLPVGFRRDVARAVIHLKEKDVKEAVQQVARLVWPDTP